MDILEQLGTALGLASLAGMNLYMTVLITGIAVHLDWVHLAERHEALAALGHPEVLTVAAVLGLMQFLADKIPWLDSAWDALHTLIRPAGAMLLSLEALGHIPPYVKVIAALLAGGVALTTHSAKAGTRLVANHSPEPFSNAILSFAEEILVFLGSILVIVKPVIAFFVFLGILIVLWIMLPKVWRILSKSIGGALALLRRIFSFGRSVA